MRKTVYTAAVAAALLAGAGAARADVIYSNKGGGVEGLDIFSSAMNAPLLEDVHLASPGAYQISGINIGYDNTGLDPMGVDVLVTFFDSVDYNVIPVNGPIASGQIGSTYRFNFNAAVAAGETGMLSLPGGPILVSDQDFGVVVNFVLPNTTTPAPGINHLFKEVPVMVGSSDALFAYDFDVNGMIDGTEEFVWGSDQFADANLFLEIDGQPVPEPATAGLAAVAGAGLLLRRRRA